MRWKRDAVPCDIRDDEEWFEVAAMGFRLDRRMGAGMKETCILRLGSVLLVFLVFVSGCKRAPLIPRSELALQLAVSRYSKSQVRSILGSPDGDGAPFEDWGCHSTLFYWIDDYHQASVYFGFDDKEQMKRYFFAP